MPRTDELLYSGMTSVTARRVKSVQRQEAEKRKEQRARLTKAGDDLVALIDQERSGIGEQLWDLINVDTQADNVKEVALALRMYANYLQQFKGQVQTVLRHVEPLGEPGDE